MVDGGLMPSCTEFDLPQPEKLNRKPGVLRFHRLLHPADHGGLHVGGVGMVASADLNLDEFLIDLIALN